MKKTLVVLVAVVALALSALSGAAGAGPNNCNGQVVAGIAATWPWAHDDRVAFPPPPGSVALWLQIFGPDIGVSSVRDLQLLFCTTP